MKLIITPLNQRLFLLSIFGACLILSLASFKIVRNWEQARSEFEFERFARNQANQVVKSFHDYQRAVQFVGSFLENTVGASRKEFKGIAENILETYPGMQAVSWNLRIRDNQRPVYEKAGRDEGFQDFQFTERGADGKQLRAAKRPEYVIVYYIEPLKGNEAALGYDIASNSKRLVSINQARDTGRIVITGKITLVQEKEKQAGILMLYPIYKRGASLSSSAERRTYLEGFSVGVLRIGQVFQETLLKDSWKRMNVYLYDESAEKENQLLYFASDDNVTSLLDKNRLEAGFHWSTSFEVGGRQWKIILTPSATFLDFQRYWQSWIVLAGMLLFTFSLLFYLQKSFGYTQVLEREISVRKQAEDTLQKTLDELEQRVEERTNALEKTHKQLLHAEKLSAIGNLSASIAHEFNNPLQGVLNILRGVARRATLDEEDAQLVTIAVNECNRMRDLIKSLQNFNRPTSGRKTTMDIHAALDDMLRLGKSAYKDKKINIEKMYAGNMPQIKAVADQIKQVFLNLLNNAADACDRGGTITVETEVLGEKVVVRIHDTGIGIKPEEIDHIFDPFFTTKPEIKGTGLGLSVSYGIIKSHGGEIDVDSEHGKGTIFSVTLPIEGGYNAE